MISFLDSKFKLLVVILCQIGGIFSKNKDMLEFEKLHLIHYVPRNAMLLYKNDCCEAGHISS